MGAVLGCVAAVLSVLLCCVLSVASTRVRERKSVQQARMLAAVVFFFTPFVPGSTAVCDTLDFNRRIVWYLDIDNHTLLKFPFEAVHVYDIPLCPST